MVDAGILEAIDAAMEAEKQANRFYLDAMEKTGSARGRDLLRQLAAFEESHHDKLRELKESLTGSGAYIAYEGTTFASITGEIPIELEEGPDARLDDVLEILRLAIDAETSAHERYRKLAKETENPEGKDMFLKLADEEQLHRRILSDEYYQLSNKGGIWSWGD